MCYTLSLQPRENIIFKIIFLAHLPKCGGRHPIPGNIQGQLGQGSEQSDLVQDVPAHCREIGLNDL